MRFKSVMLRRLSQCFLTNMPQMSQKRAVLLFPPLALRKAGEGGLGGGVVVTGALGLGASHLLQHSVYPRIYYKYYRFSVCTVT